MARNAKPVAPIAPVATMVEVGSVEDRIDMLEGGMQSLQQGMQALLAAVTQPAAPVAVAPAPVAAKPGKAAKPSPVAVLETDTVVGSKSGGEVIVKRRTTKKGKGYAVVAFHSAWGGSAILTRAQWVALCNAIRGDQQFCQNVATLLD